MDMALIDSVLCSIRTNRDDDQEETAIVKSILGTTSGILYYGKLPNFCIQDGLFSATRRVRTLCSFCDKVFRTRVSLMHIM
jgi:hypothetical protein